MEKSVCRTMLYDAPIRHIRQTIRHGVFAIRQLKFEFAPFPVSGRQRLNGPYAAVKTSTRK